MVTLDDHEARIAALEASQADHRAMLAAVNALGANQRDHSLRLTGVEGRLAGVEGRLAGVEGRLASVEFKVDDTNHRIRSLEESTSEIRDLLVRALDRDT